MKKFMTLAVLSVTTFLAACSTNSDPNRTFGANSAQTLTIAEVKRQPDDSLVTFTGKILRQVDSDEYIVADSTGEIKVDIDNHVWNGLNVTSADTIRIYGEVDKEFLHTQVDARSVEKVQQ